MTTCADLDSAIPLFLSTASINNENRCAIQLKRIIDKRKLCRAAYPFTPSPAKLDGTLVRGWPSMRCAITTRAAYKEFLIHAYCTRISLHIARWSYCRHRHLRLSHCLVRAHRRCLVSCCRLMRQVNKSAATTTSFTCKTGRQIRIRTHKLQWITNDLCCVAWNNRKNCPIHHTHPIFSNDNMKLWCQASARLSDPIRRSSSWPLNLHATNKQTSVAFSRGKK